MRSVLSKPTGSNTQTDEPTQDTFRAAAYGGEGWAPRHRLHAEEIGDVWASCGIDNEWRTLRSVLLHTPGNELTGSAGDANKVQMLAPLDVGRAHDEHAALVQTYRDHGVTVHMLDPDGEPTPNQMFCADLFAMTPQGAILARPASTVRQGEERVVARRLANIGIPIIKTLTGHATFEGADLMWIDETNVVLGQGLRTNAEAAQQISRTLEEFGVATTLVDMPVGTMHLMGMLRIVDRDLAIAWPRRTPHAAVTALQEVGMKVIFLSDSAEVQNNRAFNFVTLAPRKILMVAGNPQTQAFYESHQIECVTSPAQELAKAAGAIGCLTGILWRESSASA